jgi:gas vesicle protein
MNQLTQHSIDSGMEMPMSSMTNTSSGGKGSNLTYLLIGGGIGAALALLFAPKAGSELRTDLAGAAQKGYDTSLDMAQKMMDQSRDLYTNLKDKADQMTGGAATRIEGQVVDKVSSMKSNIMDTMANNTATDLPNGGGELLEGLSDTGAGGRDQGSAKGSNTGF